MNDAIKYMRGLVNAEAKRPGSGENFHQLMNSLRLLDLLAAIPTEAMEHAQSACDVMAWQKRNWVEANETPLLTEALADEELRNARVWEASGKSIRGWLGLAKEMAPNAGPDCAPKDRAEPKCDCAMYRRYGIFCEKACYAPAPADGGNSDGR